LGSGIRNHPALKRQRWLWDLVKPAWRRVFAGLSKGDGYAAHINDDVFRLEYAYGARYDRRDKRHYEAASYLPFVSRIREGMTVFDIGAHVGIYSLGAALRVGPRGHVVAFEPAPETLRILEHHVALNRFQDRVQVSPTLVSDSEG